MFRFDYEYTDYEQLLHGLADKLNVPVINQRIMVPAEFGSGSYAIIKLPNGLHAGLINCTIREDWLVHREKTTEEFYVLRFDELTVEGMLIVTIGDQVVHENNITTSLAYLTSSMFDWSYYGSHNSHIRGISVFFRREWLAQYLDLASTEDVLSQYIAMKAGNIHVEPLDAQYRQWLQIIFDSEESNPLYTTIVQNRIMLMIERFFDHLIRKMRDCPQRTPLSHEDINRVAQIESLLAKDILQTPPTIQQLARIAAVSESKLKKDFKTMYGLPIYEYYQRARMKFARNKLLTGNHSVKEVAMELGYANLSNFTTAFKKQFGILPSKLLRKPD